MVVGIVGICVGIFGIHCSGESFGCFLLPPRERMGMGWRDCRYGISVNHLHAQGMLDSLVKSLCRSN